MGKKSNKKKKGFLNYFAREHNNNTDVVSLTRVGLVEHLLAKAYHATSEFLQAVCHYEGIGLFKSKRKSRSQLCIVGSLRSLNHVNYFSNSSLGFSFYQSILRNLATLYFQLHLIETQFNATLFDSAKTYNRRLIESWHVIAPRGVVVLPEEMERRKRMDFLYCCRVILNTRPIAERLTSLFSGNVEDELNELFAYFHPSGGFDLGERKFTKVGLTSAKELSKDCLGV